MLNKLNPRTPALGHRTECREQGAPGFPLGTSLRCPALLNSPGFSCELFEHSKPVVRLLKWPHKRWSTCNHGCLKHIVYISFYWFVWCVIFSSDTQPMTCPLQVLMKANAIKANSTDTSITVSKTCPMDPDPFPQDHTFCGSAISYLGWFRNCHSQDVYTYSHILYQLQQDLGYHVLWNSRPAVVPCTKNNPMNGQYFSIFC